MILSLLSFMPYICKWIDVARQGIKKSPKAWGAIGELLEI